MQDSSQKVIALVSCVSSPVLYKHASEHIANNPLIVSMFDMHTGQKIKTITSHKIPKLMPPCNASLDSYVYYHLQDLSMHNCTALDPHDIALFVLKHSDLAINQPGSTLADLSVLLFERIIYAPGATALYNSTVIKDFY